MLDRVSRSVYLSRKHLPDLVYVFFICIICIKHPHPFLFKKMPTRKRRRKSQHCGGSKTMTHTHTHTHAHPTNHQTDCRSRRVLPVCPSGCKRKRWESARPPVDAGLPNDAHKNRREITVSFGSGWQWRQVW